MIPNLPEWFPFACLITGQAVRKPLLTRVFEGLLIGIVGGAFSLYIGVQLLQADVVYVKADLAAHKEWANKQVADRTEQLARERREIIERLDRIEQCLMTRACFK